MNLCYIDTETTGLEPSVNAIIQIAGVVEINGSNRIEFNIRMRPDSWHKVDQKALDINGITRAQMEQFQSQDAGRQQLMAALKPYGKLTLVGYNIGFDKGFIQQWLGQQFQYYFEYKPVDVYALAFLFAETFSWPVKNHKLATICEYLTVPLNAHDAMSDIKATQVLLRHFTRVLRTIPGQSNWVGPCDRLPTDSVDEVVF